LRSITLLCSIGLCLIIVTGVLGLAHLNLNLNLNNDQNSVRTSLQSGNPSIGNLKILNEKITKPIFSKDTVKGQVQNTGSGTIRYAAVNVNFYKNGNLIYRGTTTLTNIIPNETRNFEIEYQGSGNSPDSYNITLETSL
jgi:hypothetical protein